MVSLPSLSHPQTIEMNNSSCSQSMPQDYLAVSLVYPQMGVRMRELGASQFMSGLISSSYGAIQLFSATAHVSFGLVGFLICLLSKFIFFNLASR